VGIIVLVQMDDKDLMDPINGKWLKRYYAWKKKKKKEKKDIVWLSLSFYSS